jgi:type I restriction enzyme S subunit
VREGWVAKKFGDVCTLDRTHDNGVALPYIGLEDIVSGAGEFTGSKEPKKVQSSTFKFTSNHILYGRLRPYLNKVFLPDFSGHCSTEIFPIRPAPNVDRHYLYYWLSMGSTVKEIDLTSTGARMPRANMDAILELPISLPSLPEQQRIVAILDEALRMD